MSIRAGLLSYSFLISIFFSSCFASPPNNENAEELIIKKDTVFQPDTLNLDSMVEYEKRFALNWNDATTFSKENEEKIATIDHFAQSLDPQEPLVWDSQDNKAFAKLLYKIATYYSHVKKQADLAIDILKTANKFFVNAEDQAWTNNQLAYAYEIKYFYSNDESYKQLAMNYINAVKNSRLKDNHPTRGFAYSVQGLIEFQSDDFKKANESFKKAMSIYEATPNTKNNHYARTQTYLAENMLHECGQEKQAIELLEKVKNYWNSQVNSNENPYAARNLIVLAEAYLKVDDNNKAQTYAQQALNMYEKIYGTDSFMLSSPCQVLADVYKKMGNTQFAETYQIKANSLDQS